MKLLINYVLCLALFSLVGKSYQDEQTNGIITEGLQQFLIKLSKVLYKPNENLLFSPINVYTALSLLHLGAEGESRDEISQVLGISKDLEIPKIHQTLNEILQTVQTVKTATTPVTNETKKNLEINIANGVFIHKDFSLKKSYEENVKTYYNSEIIPVDFINNGKEATIAVNQYVANKTENHIPELYSEQVSPDTRIMLASCLYFKGLWKFKFPESATKDAPFYQPSANITVKMMQKRETARYGAIPSLNAQSVKLNFADSSVSMYIILPDENITMNDFLQNFTSNDLQKIYYETDEEVDLNLKMPRTVFTWSDSLQTKLNQLGIKKIFTEAAQLDNMVDNKLVKVTEVTHATDIKITEEGTEGAAVSVSKIGLRLGRFNRHVNLEVNRPFLSIIYHNKIRSVLFFGIVNNPLY